MNFADEEESIERLKVIWWTVLGCALALLLYVWGSAAYNHQAEEYAQRGWFAHLIHYGDPNGTAFLFLVGGCLGIKFLKNPALFIAGCHYEWMQKAKAERDRRDTNAKFQDFQIQSRKDRARSGVSQAKREIISRLGTVDDFLRVLEVETDGAKRTVTLQSAHAEILALEEKRVADEMPAEALTHPEILAHAQATREHLAQIGLAEDRLNLEISRLFNMPGN